MGDHCYRQEKMNVTHKVMWQTGKSKLTVAVQSAFFLCGLLFFTWFSHRSHYSLLFTLPCLVVPAFIVAVNVRSAGDMFSVFGLHMATRKTLLYLPVASLTGLLLAMLYRHYTHFPVLPSQLTAFAVTAAAVGTVEELLFRGFLQSQLRKINVTASVLLATASHTTYKVVLFTALQNVFKTDLFFLLVMTFLSGLIFGVIKEYSRNVIFPIAGHITFDLVVYGGSTLIPWWVW
jgi:membrane protease YdiL (CAAX protease family)